MNERTYHVFFEEMDECSLCNLYSWRDYQDNIFEAECLYNNDSIKTRF